MTKYRIISDGYANHLQYLYEYKVMFFFKKSKWKYIWTPYYDEIWGRQLDCSGYKTLICSYNTKFDEFVKKWPEINEYFNWATKEQNRLENITRYINKKLNDKKSEIVYL